MRQIIARLTLLAISPAVLLLNTDCSEKASSLLEPRPEPPVVSLQQVSSVGASSATFVISVTAGGPGEGWNTGGVCVSSSGTPTWESGLCEGRLGPMQTSYTISVPGLTPSTSYTARALVIQDKNGRPLVYSGNTLTFRTLP